MHGWWGFHTDKLITPAKPCKQLYSRRAARHAEGCEESTVLRIDETGQEHDRGIPEAAQSVARAGRNRLYLYAGLLALIACVIGLALTGWLYTTDRFWGDETVDAIHQVLAWTLLTLAALHVSGVVLTSIRHRENLVRAMFNGKKSAARGTDVD